jgi:hypothetical protein
MSFSATDYELLTLNSEIFPLANTCLVAGVMPVTFSHFSPGGLGNCPFSQVFSVGIGAA